MDYISPKEAVLKVKRWPKDSLAAGCAHTVGLKKYIPAMVERKKLEESKFGQKLLKNYIQMTKLKE